MPSRNRASILLEQLAIRMRAANWSLVPPVRDLAREFGVARKTVTTALSLLREKGLVEEGPGRRYAVTALAHQGQRTIGRQSRAELLAQAIRDAIVSGHYKADSSLPTVNHYREKYRVGSDTVASAFSILFRENMVYKKGKKWMAGKVTTNHHASRTVILVATNSCTSALSLEAGANSLANAQFRKIPPSKARNFLKEETTDDWSFFVSGNPDTV